MSELDKQAIEAAAKALFKTSPDMACSLTLDASPEAEVYREAARGAIAAYLAARGEGKETPDEPANG